jgi:hypothetical protein
MNKIGGVFTLNSIKVHNELTNAGKRMVAKWLNSGLFCEKNNHVAGEKIFESQDLVRKNYSDIIKPVHYVLSISATNSVEEEHKDIVGNYSLVSKVDNIETYTNDVYDLVFEKSNRCAYLIQKSDTEKTKLYEQNGINYLYSYNKNGIVVIQKIGSDLYQNVHLAFDCYDNTAATSNTTSDKNITFEFKKPLNSLRGIGFYGEKTASYNNSDYGVTLNVYTIIDEKEYCKSYSINSILTPLKQYDYKMSFDENSSDWAGGKYYKYVSFDRMFLNPSWFYEDDNKNKILSETRNEEGTFDKPYIDKITKIEIVDKMNSYNNLNEIDIFTEGNNYKIPAMSYMKIGNSNAENNPEFTDLVGTETKIIPIEYSEIEGNKVRFGCVLISTGGETINEIGIFNNNDEMFARAVLDETIMVNENEYFHLYYDLEI